MTFTKRRRTSRKTSSKKKSARGGRKSSSVSSSVKSYVKKAISLNIENKCVQINSGQSFGNVRESPDFNAFPMCPLSGYWTVGQGVGQGSRIGNIIKTKKVYLNYILRPNPYDAVFNASCRPMEIQLMLGYVKNTPCFAPIGGDVDVLFNAGSTSAAPQGTLKDIISVINTDYWTIKKRWTHKIGYSSAEGTGGNVANQFFANNDFKLNAVKRVDITKHCPVTHCFNDASQTTNTRGLFLMYYAVAADNFNFSATQLPANIEFWVDFHYEDA